MRLLVLHLDDAGRDKLAASLRDDGHDVTAVDGEPRAPVTPQVFVVCLDANPQRTLDLAAKVGAGTGIEASSILFVGGSPAALSEAQRRFPTASFSRVDALSTAIASMEM